MDRAEIFGVGVGGFGGGGDVAGAGLGAGEWGGEGAALGVQVVLQGHFAGGDVRGGEGDWAGVDRAAGSAGFCDAEEARAALCDGEFSDGGRA